MLSPLRHATVALSAVVALSCALHAEAQTASRPEFLLRQMALSEKPGQRLQHAGGRNTGLNFRWIGASSGDLRANGSFEITKSHTGTAPAAALPTRVIVSGN